jgi:hypothetical protein
MGLAQDISVAEDVPERQEMGRIQAGRENLSQHKETTHQPEHEKIQNHALACSISL